MEFLIRLKRDSATDGQNIAPEGKVHFVGEVATDLSQANAVQAMDSERVSQEISSEISNMEFSAGGA